jgi:hypothetical protein
MPSISPESLVKWCCTFTRCQLQFRVISMAQVSRRLACSHRSYRNKDSLLAGAWE